jgi:RiboL-PSP-HEPN
LTDVAAKTALTDFLKDIDRVEQLLELIRIFREFASQEAELSGYAQDLWITAKEVRTDLPILSGSLLLYLCGRFEYFARELVGTIVDELVDKTAKYMDLPEALRKEYLIRTLLINQSPAKYDHTPATASVLAVELAGNLSGVNDDSPNLRLDANTITITETNMNPGTLVDLFKRVGIINLWDTLGKQLPLKTYLGEVTDNGCKAVAITRLEEIMKERNKVAHPTGATAFPDVNIVEDIAQYFRVLAQVLVDLALAPR